MQKPGFDPQHGNRRERKAHTCMLYEQTMWWTCIKRSIETHPFVQGVQEYMLVISKIKEDLYGMRTESSSRALPYLAVAGGQYKVFLLCCCLDHPVNHLHYCLDLVRKFPDREPASKSEAYLFCMLFSCPMQLLHHCPSHCPQLLLPCIGVITDSFSSVLQILP